MQRQLLIIKSFWVPLTTRNLTRRRRPTTIWLLQEWFEELKIQEVQIITIFQTVEKRLSWSIFHQLGPSITRSSSRNFPSDQLMLWLLQLLEKLSTVRYCHIPPHCTHTHILYINIFQYNKQKLPSVRLELTTFRLWDWRANQLRQEGWGWRIAPNFRSEQIQLLNLHQR